MGERTGSRVFQWVWSYVVIPAAQFHYKAGMTRKASRDNHR
ncbi:hypothetical protein CTRU02_202126 [Colletotrichum truncatum]|uniref:Uncharacterized protein n=1 Tax=Colletotrichum truncatum TaxID=5467 RepID=A0ACC3ZJE3_COLTU